MDNQPQPTLSQGQNPQIPQPAGSTSTTPPVNNYPPQPSTNPLSNPVSLPLSNAPLNSDPQNPVVVGGQDVNYDIDSDSHHLNLWLIFAGAVSLILIIGAALYLWFLPTQWANSYLKSIKPLYKQQRQSGTQ